MSEPKFTRSRAVWIGGDGRQFIVDAENPAHVISEYPHATDRHVADAALDLAAPDLYDVLVGLVDATDGNEGQFFCVNARLGACGCLRCVAIAALYKARGEATQ